MSLAATMLAYADAPDPNDISQLLVLLMIAILGCGALLAAVPILIARRRSHRQVEGITVGVFFWAVLAIASSTVFTLAQFKWSKERQTRINSGYYDPRDKTAAPAKPWVQWSVLAVAYGGILAVSLSPTKASTAPVKPQETDKAQ